MSYDKWSEEGRKAILRAPVEAKELGHQYVGSEHLLLALLNSDTALAARILKELGITKPMAQKKLLEICKRMETKKETPTRVLFQGREIPDLVTGKIYTVKILKST
jgi:ATP-dependent Clp protease ATP-binding subunit ClpA